MAAFMDLEMRRLAALVCLLGCATTPDNLGVLRERGVAVPIEEVPKAVIDGFENGSGGNQILSTERTSSGFYRLETRDGSVLFFDESGKYVGRIM